MYIAHSTAQHRALVLDAVSSCRLNHTTRAPDPLLSTLQLAAVVKSFGEQLAKKAADRAAYQREHGIQAVPQGMAQQLMAQQQKQAAAAAASGSAGDEDGGGAGRPAGILA